MHPHRLGNKDHQLLDKRKPDPKRRAAVITIFCPYQSLVRLDNGARDGQTHVQQIPTTEGNVVLRHQDVALPHFIIFKPARHADVEPRCPAFANLRVNISGLYAWELQLRKLAPIF